MKRFALTKETMLIFGFSIILFIIIIAIIAISLFSPKQTQITPTPTPELNPTQAVLQTPTSSVSKDSPAFLYNKESQDVLLEKITNRETLATSDIQAKEKILATLPTGQTSGVLYQSDNIIIDYTSGIDLFQVEIMTTDINRAKEEAVSWFLLQGVSMDAVCNYPVQFYLNYYVAQELLGKDINFTSLAPGCK